MRSHPSLNFGGTSSPPALQGCASKSQPAKLADMWGGQISEWPGLGAPVRSSKALGSKTTSSRSITQDCLNSSVLFPCPECYEATSRSSPQQTQTIAHAGDLTA